MFNSRASPTSRSWGPVLASEASVGMLSGSDAGSCARARFRQAAPIARRGSGARDHAKEGVDRSPAWESFDRAVARWTTDAVLVLNVVDVRGLLLRSRGRFSGGPVGRGGELGSPSSSPEARGPSHGRGLVRDPWRRSRRSTGRDRRRRGAGRRRRCRPRRSSRSPASWPCWSRRRTCCSQC